MSRKLAQPGLTHTTRTSSAPRPATRAWAARSRSAWRLSRSSRVTAFAAAGVRFLVVGAHALAAHGVPRVTGALDLWVDPTPENAAAIWRALAAFGAPLATLAVHESDFHRDGIVAQFGLPPYRVDVMTSISGVAFSEAWPARVSCEMWGVAVDCIGRDELIRNKRASGRRKDLADVAALLGEQE